MHIFTTWAALLEKGRPASKSNHLESNFVLSCSWEDIIHFFNFQIHHLARPSLGIQGGSNVSKYFVNGC